MNSIPKTINKLEFQKICFTIIILKLIHNNYNIINYGSNGIILSNNTHTIVKIAKYNK